MSWIYLIIAGVFEIGWPFGFKMASVTGNKFLWIGFAIVAMALSGYFLFVAQKTIPIGTAYAIWTGVGAIGTFMLGVAVFGDALTMMRALGVLLILSGVIVLKVA